MQVVWRVPETPQPPQPPQPQQQPHGGGASSISSSSAENGSTSSQAAAAAAFTSSSSSLPTVVEGSRESASSARDSYRTQPASPRTPAAAASQGFPTGGFGSSTTGGAGSSSCSTIGAVEENYCPPGLGEQVLEAARCCLRMLTDLHGFSPVSGVTLKLHIGIGAGRMTAYTVGGHMKKWYA